MAFFNFGSRIVTFFFTNAISDYAIQRKNSISPISFLIIKKNSKINAVKLINILPQKCGKTLDGNKDEMLEIIIYNTSIGRWDVKI